MGGWWGVEAIGSALEEVGEVKGKTGAARAEPDDRSSTGEGGSDMSYSGRRAEQESA